MTKYQKIQLKVKFFVSQITDIAPQKKKENRFNIFIDGKFAFGIDTENLIKFKLKIGKEVSLDEEAKINQSKELEFLMDRTLNFLSFRPRSKKEVLDYLAKRIAVKNEIKFADAQGSAVIEKIIKKLQKFKYLNDVEFTKWWIRSRSQSSPKGPSALKFELLKKGIDKNIVEKQILKSVNPKRLAKTAVEKKIKSWQRLEPLEFKKKFFQYLAFRGFDYDTISELFAIYSKKS